MVKTAAAPEHVPQALAWSTGRSHGPLVARTRPSCATRGSCLWVGDLLFLDRPAEELDFEALQLEQGPDRGGFAEKVSLIEKARASGVAETESMVVQQLPMPSLAACERAGQEIAQAFTLPSQMTITRYVCVRGR